MHYTVEFSGNTKAEKDTQALKYCFEYLSKKQRIALAKMRQETMPEVSIKNIVKKARFICGITGMNGYYPRRAIIKYLAGK